MYGEDPNWGRIVAAAGSARAGNGPGSLVISLNRRTWVAKGAIELLSEAEAHRELAQVSIDIELDLGIGECEATAWGCDLSRDYVRINASYRT